MRTTWPEQIVSGQRYGRLLIFDRIPASESPSSHRWYRALCDCGARVLVCGPRVASGEKKSCGCLRDELNAERKMVALQRRTHVFRLPMERRPKAPVDLAVFREAFKRSGLTVQEVAQRSGMDHTHVSRLVTNKTLISRKRGKTYGPYPYKACRLETALKLMKGLDLDPWEVGI